MIIKLTFSQNKSNKIFWFGINWKLYLHKKWTFCKSYSVFSHLYNLATGRHNHRTGYALNGLLILLNFNTVKFGTKAFLYFTIASSSSFQASFSEKDFRILSPISLKKLLKDYFISLYFEEIPFLCFCMCIYIV